MSVPTPTLPIAVQVALAFTPWVDTAVAAQEAIETVEGRADAGGVEPMHDWASRE